MTTVVRGGTVVTDRSATRADVVIDDRGRIAAVVPAGHRADETGAAVIDATGLVVMPGMVDAHVHFQEPGREEWEGFDTGSAAAAAGGVTTVVDMPIDCDPPTVTAALVVAKVDAARRHSRVDVAVWGGLVPGSVDELAALVEAGVVGFKAFACPSGWDDFPPVDEPTLSAGMEVAARLDVPVAVHCELEELGHTVESERAAIRWCARVASAAGARLHVVHVSSAAAVDEARRWPGVTVETCPHYLVLTDTEAVACGAVAHCFPPIRDKRNLEALWARVADGGIDVIASDHSPCPPAAKAKAQPWAGIDGVGMALPLLISSAQVTLPAIADLTTKAARLLRLATKGQIAPGFDADLALVDVDQTWEVMPDRLRTRHRQSPYAGMTVKGRVIKTLRRGEVIFDVDDGPGPAGGGRLVRPSPI